MTRVAICDDNKAVLKELRIQVERCITEPIEVKTFVEPEKMRQYLQSEARIDILLLDIMLEEEDGIRLAKQIRKARPDIQIIFITGYLEQAKRIFHAGPSYFLVKPIRDDSLKKVLADVLAEIEKEKEQYLTLQMKSGIYKVNIRDICYIESKIRTLFIHTAHESETIYMKMDEMIGLLPDTFLRVHKSFLVNMDKICRFSSEGVLLENDKWVPISRTRYKEAKLRFLGYCGGAWNDRVY